MTTRESSKRKRRPSTPPVNKAITIEDVLKLVPNARARDVDSALTLHNALLIVRGIMREHFGIDPQATKRPQHIDVAMGLLQMALEEGRHSSGVTSATERDAARRKRRSDNRREELERLLREHRGNVSEVARIMSKAPTQIFRWLKRYEIDAAAYREGPTNEKSR